MPADALTGFGFKPFVKVNGLLDQPAELVGKRVQRDKARGMPGRPSGQLGSLEQADIVPASMSQAIQYVGANTATSDDNNARM